ncbi:MAG: C40 family peptidase [Prevotella sp.]|nr:C40 family peptidase [Prevotella sp.]MCM1075452.1 C40 family peptidase [Ruminococcus sp.]
MKRLFLLLCICLCACCLWANRFAIVKIPVACIRTKPAHAAEQSSQAILGSPVKILSKSGDWCRILTPDDYSGYVRENSLQFLSDEQYAQWKQSPRIVCRAWLSRLVDADGLPAGYATFGSMLVKDAHNPDSTRISVICPSGETLYANAADFYPDLATWVEQCTAAGAMQVIETAFSMLGDPYLWGGTSSLAPDCSGFTQLVFQRAGILLPRDTSMQIKCGEPVNSIDEAKEGDLIFYGDNGRVNHVAIYMGNKTIIHSSGSVRICRMSNDAPGDAPLFPQQPMAIRRILGSPAGCQNLLNHPMYFS